MKESLTGRERAVKAAKSILQVLRRGTIHYEFRFMELTTLLEKYGITLEELDTTEEEISTLRKECARLSIQPALLHLRLGTSKDVILDWIILSNALKDINAEEVGITEEELEAIERKAHVELAKQLLSYARALIFDPRECFIELVKIMRDYQISTDEIQTTEEELLQLADQLFSIPLEELLKKLH
jgi:hypothetical protein